MKLVSFLHGSRPSYGIVTDGGVVDLGARLGVALPDLKTFLAARALGLADAVPAAGPDLALADLTLQPVIPNPAKILCVGINYEEHREETGRTRGAHPTIFTRFADTLVAPGAPLHRPPVSTAFDFEGELAVVIGRPAFRVSEEQAQACVAGYTCFNDATLRDWQRHSHQFTPGKNFPGTGALGPVLVTPDELDRFAERRIETRLNGRVMQSAALGEMFFPVAAVVAYVSGFTRLSSGDIIATGTPGGVGFKRTPPVFMQPGDTVEVSIDGIGTLSNGVIDEPVTSHGQID